VKEVHHKGLRTVLGAVGGGRGSRDVAGRGGVFGVVDAGAALRLGIAVLRTRGDGVAREAEDTMDPWQEAGSKGLDTWFELPVAYAAITDGRAEPVGNYENCSSPMDHEVVSPAREKTWCEGYYARLKHRLAR
jgi:hypothetical protein